VDLQPISDADGTAADTAGVIQRRRVIVVGRSGVAAGSVLWPPGTKSWASSLSSTTLLVRFSRM